MVMEERSSKADGRTGERWGISGLRLGEQHDPCWRLHLRRALENVEFSRRNRQLAVSSKGLPGTVRLRLAQNHTIQRFAVRSPSSFFE